MIARCLTGTRDACYSLAQGYEQGAGLARDATRAAFYYEKACDSGHAAACAHLGKTAPGPPAPAGRVPFGVLALLAIGGVAGTVLFVSRRRAT